MDTNEARVLNLDALLAQQRMLLQHCVNKAVNTGSDFNYVFLHIYVQWGAAQNTFDHITQ